jgi:hypothetical protein
MNCVRLASLAAITAVVLSVSVGGQASGNLPGEIVGRIRSVPVSDRIDYVVKGAVRPFPLVWIGRDNVGTGQFIRRLGANGVKAFEVIVGSDPARAPRQINRWGYLGEEVRTDGGSIVGLLKQSDEQSISDVNASMRRQAEQRRFPFRVYAGAIGGGHANLGGSTFVASQDFTRWGFETLLGLVAGTKVPLTRSSLAPGTRTGLLSTVSELLHDSVEAWRRKVPDPIRGKRVAYLFNNTTYQLHVAGTDFRRSADIGGTRYDGVVHANLEGSQPGTDKRMSFEVWYPTTGAYAGLPIRVIVQPRWWFRFELTAVAPPR